MSNSNRAEEGADRQSEPARDASGSPDPALDVRGFAVVRRFSRLLLGALPAAAICILAAVVWWWLVVAPTLQARGQPLTNLHIAEGFLFTDVEAHRLKQTDLVREGVWAADLKPWQIARNGIGGISYDPEQSSAFNEILQRFGGNAEQRLDRASLEQALVGLGRGNRAAVQYLQALAYYRSGQYDLARERTEKTLALIKGARAGARSDNARMRLDGEEIATRYLLGYIEMGQGKRSEAEDAFLSALNLALQAHSYPPYYAVASATIFALKPEYHLIDISTATLWNDYLNALNAKNPDRAWETVAERHLLDDPEGVRTSPYLAATLQLLAISHGRADLVSLLDAGPSPGRAGQARAAARLVAGLDSDLAPQANTPDEDLLRPWSAIASERPALASVLAPVANNDPPADASTAGPDPHDKAFVDTWRRQYLKELGQRLLRRGAHENPEYFKAILKSDQFPGTEKFSAATRLSGVGPYFAGLFMLLLAVAFIAALGAFWIYVQAFWPMHYASRVAWARRRPVRRRR